MSTQLFTPRHDGSFRSLIPKVGGLDHALEALITPTPRLPEFGPTYADASQEEFWRLMVRSGQEAELAEARGRLHELVRAKTLSADELGELTRLCNAARLAPEVDREGFAYDLLTTIVVEASEAMLAAECAP